jgi:hypothetical protein
MRHMRSTLVSTCPPPFPIVATQRLRKQVPAATNTNATTGELLDVVFSIRVVSNRPTQYVVK